jgi:hypothetical protein
MESLDLNSEFYVPPMQGSKLNHFMKQLDSSTNIGKQILKKPKLRNLNSIESSVEDHSSLQFNQPRFDEEL